MIRREELLNRVKRALRRRPVTALLGPRQCGKTTLAREIARERKGAFFDLENPVDLSRLQNPMGVLGPLKGLVILDEIQRMPELMPILRVLADRRPCVCRFLLLGSASPEMVRGSSESLAGRVEFVDMAGLTLEEVGAKRQEQLWMRGGFPDSFLAENDGDSRAWRENFIQTFLERDIPQLGIRIPSMTLRRFWTMVAHCHGQRWNGAQIAGSLGIGDATSRRYLDLLTGAFVVRQVPPWFENTSKRLVKSPKIYIRDSGILHSLLNIQDKAALESNPKLGSSWEGFVVEQIISRVGERNAYFWGTHGGAELDLLVLKNGKRWGFEMKCSDAPTATKSMHVAMEDLKLSKLWVVHPGEASYPLDRNIECIGLRHIEKIKSLVGV